VLDGFLFYLLGLYDLRRNRRPEFIGLFSEGVQAWKTLPSVLGLSGKWIWYGRTATFLPPHYMTLNYLYWVFSVG